MKDKSENVPEKKEKWLKIVECLKLSETQIYENDVFNSDPTILFQRIYEKWRIFKVNNYEKPINIFSMKNYVI